jgi:hypothetical protein
LRACTLFSFGLHDYVVVPLRARILFSFGLHDYVAVPLRAHGFHWVCTIIVLFLRVN